MTNHMQAGEFKSKCLGVMDTVRRTKRSVIITKRNVPIAKLVPLDYERPSLFGCMKDSVKFLDDMTKPVGEKWDVIS